MLSKIVTAKLKESRRLVIPELGVFVVRDDGRILFSELMRTDDGVLRAAVAAERGTGEDEAARTVARFVADIRHTLEHGMSYRLEGLGVLSLDDRGLTTFKSRGDEEHRHSRSALERILAESAQPEMPKRTTADDKPESVVKETAAADGDVPRRPQPRPRPKRKRRGGTDVVLVAAIVIAVAAICAILYGVWVNGNREDGGSFKEMFVPSSGSAATPDDASNGDATPEADDTVDLSIPSGR